MSDKLQLVKALLQGIRDDNGRYETLRQLLERQRLCMIRRASDELRQVNDEIERDYEQLAAASRQRHSLLQQLGVTANRAGMAQVFGWLPAPQRSAAQGWWRQLERQIERCKSYNEKNGDLLIRQYEFAQSFLGGEPDFLYQP